MANQPTLRAVSEKLDTWKCSACGEQFSGPKMKVVNLFGAHIRQVHIEPAKPKEDFSQAVLRVTKEDLE